MIKEGEQEKTKRLLEGELGNGLFNQMNIKDPAFPSNPLDIKYGIRNPMLVW
jgi:hypothetical protein